MDSPAEWGGGGNGGALSRVGLLGDVCCLASLTSACQPGRSRSEEGDSDPD